MGGVDLRKRLELGLALVVEDLLVDPHVALGVLEEVVRAQAANVVPARGGGGWMAAGETFRSSWKRPLGGSAAMRWLRRRWTKQRRGDSGGNGGGGGLEAGGGAGLQAGGGGGGANAMALGTYLQTSGSEKWRLRFNFSSSIRLRSCPISSSSSARCSSILPARGHSDHHQ